MKSNIFRLPGPRDVKRFVSKEMRNRQESSEKYKTACAIRSGPAWRNLVHRLGQERSVCEWCQCRPSEQGHHIRPVSDNPGLALNPDNVWMVCEKCHILIESAVKRGVDVEELMRSKGAESVGE